MTYSGSLGDWYNGLDTQTLVPKKYFSSFLFSVVFRQKFHWSVNQWFDNASKFFEMAENTKMQTEDKNNKTKEVEAKEETVGESVFFHLTM